MITIITYNIHKGFTSGKKNFVLPDIKQALSEESPDILFLQEIHGEHRKHATKIEEWPTETQFEYLAEEIWPHFAYGKNAIYKKGHHGNAILSKHPFKSWDNIDISMQKRASRSLLHGIIELPELNQPLHVICAHLGLFKKERAKQLQILCDRIESHVPHDEPLIIAGDFNDWRKQADDFLHHDLNIEEAFKVLTGDHAKSYPAKNPTLKVDRIYYRGLKPELCKRLKWKHLSDHIPLMAVFSF